MYLDEVQTRMAAGCFGVGFVDLPMTSQFQLQKKFVAAQNGTVVTTPNGEKVDARDIPNSSGGKRKHRVANNRLVMNSKNGKKHSGLFDEEEKMKLQMEEAMKRSMMDEREFHLQMDEARKRSLLTDQSSVMNSFNKKQKKVKNEEDRKMPAVRNEDEVIEIDDAEEDDDYRRRQSVSFSRIENEAITDGRAAEMYARSKDRIMKTYRMELAEFKSMNNNKENKEEKKRKRAKVKKLKQQCIRLTDEEKNGEHISLIKRVTSNGKELFSPEPIKSQEVVDMILEEYELDEEEDDEEE